MPDQLIQELIVKQEIRDVLSRYCRGLDRMDKEMAYSVWHDDATALYYDMYEGTGHGFIDWVWVAHGGMQCHSHQITNVLTRVDGDKAVSEAYVSLVLWTMPSDDGKQMEIAVRGRYLDRWSLRDNKWAIDHREFVTATHTLRHLTKGPVSDKSTRDMTDASFDFIEKYHD
ncbi:MAG: nuclear transport factor 2 family protein [Deltaproteobacteria bacterium]|nr:nuclear transport factor 2 family protein [Deltaproteobacteria bacterium]